MKNNITPTNRRASALVEVLLVVAGIGIAAGLFVPTVRNTIEWEDSNKSAIVALSE